MFYFVWTYCLHSLLDYFLEKLQTGKRFQCFVTQCCVSASGGGPYLFTFFLFCDF